jgi:hypothetical protein
MGIESLHLAQNSHSLWLKTTTFLLRDENKQIKSADMQPAVGP